MADKINEPSEQDIQDRWDKKKEHLGVLANCIRKVRYNVSLGLKSDNEKEFLSSLVIALLDKTAERVGNEGSASDGHVGITGLLKEHVSISGNSVTLEYTGKSGVDHEKTFCDDNISEGLKRAIKNSPDDSVFTTSDGFKIKADRINRILNEYGISAKDLRGFSVNKWVIDKIKNLDAVESDPNKRKRQFNKILKQVAKKVGHGAPTLKNHYLMPEVETEFMENGGVFDIKDFYKEGGVVGGGEIDNKEIVCENCGWSWLKEDGGADTYICHMCGHDNTSKYLGVLKKGGSVDSNQAIYKKWESLVNMSASELQTFMDTPEGKAAGLTKEEADQKHIHYGRESARWISKMKATPVSRWTPDMWEWAKRQISFVSRMSGNRGALRDDEGNMTRKLTSLLIWGHNPEKMTSGGEINNMNKAYLMTLEDYTEKVIPLVKEFRKFLSKNKYFISLSYGGYTLYSYPELQAAMHNKENLSVKFNFSEIRSYETPEQQLNRGWLLSLDKEAPQSIIDQKNEYISKLNDIFGNEYVERNLEDTDNAKSNKRAIRYAIDHDIYTKLLKEGKVEYAEIEKVANSAGVKLPKKVSESQPVDQLNQKKYAELYSTLPSVNRAKLEELVKTIEASYSEFAAKIEEAEYQRMREVVGHIWALDEITMGKFTQQMPYDGVFDIAKMFVTRREEQPQDKFGRKEVISYYNIPPLTANWEVTLREEVKKYVETLKYALIGSILNNFIKLSKPIANISKDFVRLGAKGFEGGFNFEFIDGSKFTFETQAIVAGGYNIQILHLRYLSAFKNVVYENGTKKSSASLYEIIQNFSDKEELKKKSDPLAIIEGAESLGALILGLYTYLKESKLFLTNVRKYPTSVSYHRGHRSRAIYFNPTDDLDVSKAKAKKHIEEVLLKPNTMATGGPIDGTIFYDFDGEQRVVKVQNGYVYYVASSDFSAYEQALKDNKFFSTKLEPIAQFEKTMARSDKFASDQKSRAEFDKQTEAKIATEKESARKANLGIDGFLSGEKDLQSSNKRHNLTKYSKISFDGNSFFNIKDFVEWAHKHGLKPMIAYEFISKETGSKSRKNQEQYDRYVKQYGEPSSSSVKKIYRIGNEDNFVEVGKIANDYLSYLNSSSFKLGGSISKLLAPNGSISNLTDEQYSLVRTPEFISWFGDWLNNPENSSKVLDENGEPLVVYHGSSVDFDEFQNKTPDIGFHFGTLKSSKSRLRKTINSYKNGIIKPFFLNIRRIKESKDLKNWHSLYLNDQAINDGAITKDESDEEWRKILSESNIKFSKNEDWKAIFVWRDQQFTNWIFKRYYSQFDGIKYINDVEDKGSTSYLVFKPNNIKVATGKNVSFNAISNNMNLGYGGTISEQQVMDFSDEDYGDGGAIDTNYLQSDKLKKEWAGQYEMVPIEVVKGLREFHRVGKDVNKMFFEDKKAAQSYIDKMKKWISESGWESPLMVDYYQWQKKALLTEGNHRLESADQLGLKYVPIAVYRTTRDDRTGKAKPVSGYVTKREGDSYVPANLLPSQIGLPVMQKSEMENGGELEGDKLRSALELIIKENVGALSVLGYVQYEIATQVKSNLDTSNMPHGNSEADIEFRSQEFRILENHPPQYNKFTIGQKAIDRFGELYELMLLPVSELVVKREGTQREETVEKYANWLRQTGNILPIKGVQNFAEYSGRVAVTDGAHRVASTLKAGIDNIPVWVALTNPKNISMPIYAVDDIIEKYHADEGVRKYIDHLIVGSPILKKKENKMQNGGQINKKYQLGDILEWDTDYRTKERGYVSGFYSDEIPLITTENGKEYTLTAIMVNGSFPKKIYTQESLKSETGYDYADIDYLTGKGFFNKESSSEFDSPLFMKFNLIRGDSENGKKVRRKIDHGLDEFPKKPVSTKTERQTIISNIEAQNASKNRIKYKLRKLINYLSAEKVDKYDEYIKEFITDFNSGVSFNRPKIERLGLEHGIEDQNIIKELTELALVKIARGIAHEKNKTVKQRFEEIVQLYHNQVNLSHRTSESVLFQQYSTPAPIGYMMGVYCGVDENELKPEVKNLVTQKIKYAYKKGDQVFFQKTQSEVVNADIVAPSTVNDGIQIWSTTKGYAAENKMLPKITSAKKESAGQGYKAFKGMGGGSNYRVEFADGDHFTSYKQERGDAIADAVFHRLHKVMNYPKTIIEDVVVEVETDSAQGSADKLKALIDKIRSLNEKQDFSGLNLPKPIENFYSYLRKSEVTLYTWSIYGKGFVPFGANKINDFFWWVYGAMHGNKDQLSILKDKYNFTLENIAKADFNSITFKDGRFINRVTSQFKGSNMFYAGTQYSQSNYVLTFIEQAINDKVITEEQAKQLWRDPYAEISPAGPVAAKKVFFEPSAGNGMLTLAADPQDFIVNELSEFRNRNLKTQGYAEVLKLDAENPIPAFYHKFDAVLTNPPFGALEEKNLEFNNFKITSLEHLMSIRALETMKDTGKAAIIIGGHTNYDSEGRIQSGKNRIYFSYLCKMYNVEDVIQIDGQKLYSRMGTSFNTRLILINGRKKEPNGFAPLKVDVSSEFPFSPYPVRDYETFYKRIASHLEN